MENHIQYSIFLITVNNCLVNYSTVKDKERFQQQSLNISSPLLPFQFADLNHLPLSHCILMHFWHNIYLWPERLLIPAACVCTVEPYKHILGQGTHLSPSLTEISGILFHMHRKQNLDPAQVTVLQILSNQKQSLYIPSISSRHRKSSITLWP